VEEGDEGGGGDEGDGESVAYTTTSDTTDDSIDPIEWEAATQRLLSIGVSGDDLGRPKTGEAKCEEGIKQPPVQNRDSSNSQEEGEDSNGEDGKVAASQKQAEPEKDGSEQQEPEHKGRTGAASKSSPNSRTRRKDPPPDQRDAALDSVSSWDPDENSRKTDSSGGSADETPTETTSLLGTTKPAYSENEMEDPSLETTSLLGRYDESRGEGQPTLRPSIFTSFGQHGSFGYSDDKKADDQF